MRKMNLFCAVILLATFIGSGYVLMLGTAAFTTDYYLRLSNRANHVYLLLIALLNLLSFRTVYSGRLRWPENVSRALLAAGGVIEAFGFVFEAGVIAAAVGVILFFINEMCHASKKL